MKLKEGVSAKRIPVPTPESIIGADGKAVFEVEAGSKWKAKFVSGTEYTYFEDGSNEVTLIKQ